jgi:hypothetical protein
VTDIDDVLCDPETVRVLGVGQLNALGFEHNNCIGCVKSASAGYWNRTRRLFPDVFERRAQQSRVIGARLVKIKGVRAFLDELPEDAYAPDDAIDCGPTCQAPDFRSEGEEP